MSTLTAIYTWFATLDPRIWQAVIAGVFVAGGWIVNGSQNRRRSLRMRQERLRDVHRALFAEIGANLQTLGTEEDLWASSAAVVERMRKGAVQGEPYLPFVVRDRKDEVFASIIGEIHILPRTTIDAVVAYYAQLKVIADVTEDLRGESFAALPVERQIKLYEDLTGMKVLAIAFGNHALRMIDTYARDGKQAAQALDQELKKETVAFEIKRLKAAKAPEAEPQDTPSIPQDEGRSGPS
ncbi:hypothetical protein AADZ90_007665 [Aestuariibius sp. 2305UL40-4]|uniref:hypothetical protein n=1 Tax=Aestuariibius violaceus TaxID=3234132 RepID=UPI00345E49AA